MTIEESIRSAIDGNAVLFLGSGFSLGATNVCGVTIPSANQTCERLISEGDIDVSGDSDDDKKNLEYISDLYCDKLGEDSMVSFLKRQFLCKDYTKQLGYCIFRMLHMKTIYLPVIL